MDKLFTDGEYQKRINAVTLEDAIDYVINNTIGNTTDGKGEYIKITHPISIATANYLNILKSIQDRNMATNFVIDTYKNDLKILSRVDFNKIIDLVGIDEEQALENCVSAMRTLIQILEAINKDRENIAN